MSDVVLVLGMHRSGTSAVSGALASLGGGLPKTLMPAHESNERGFFESVAFMNFHDELLASAGSQWDDWRALNPGWRRSPAATEFKRRAKCLFAEEFGNAPLPILKDPRICRFPNFWLDALREMDAKPHIVMPVRSPLDVARSMRKLHGIPLTKGLLMWLRHVLDAEAQTRDQARSIFDWRDFRADWRGACDKIAMEADLSWPRASDRASREIERFLSEDLVHHRAERAVNADVSEWTLGTYEALQQLARNPLSNSVLGALDEFRARLDQSSQLFGRLLMDYEVDLEEARAREAAAQAEREGLVARADHAAREREALAREKDEIARALSAAAAERDALAGRGAGLEAEIEARRRDAAEAARERDALAGSHAELGLALRALERALTEAEARRDQLTAAQAALTDELEARRRELAEAVARAGQAAAERDARAQENEGLSRSLSAVAAHRDQLIGAHASLAGELDALRGEISILAARVEEAAIERNSALRERDELAGRLSAAAAERDRLDLAHSALIAQSAEAARLAAQDRDARDEVQRALAADVRAREHQLAAVDAQRDALAEAGARLEADLEASRAEIARLGALAKEAASARDEASGEIVALKQRLHASLAERDALDTAKTRLLDEINAAARARAEADAEVAELRARLSSAETAHELAVQVEAAREAAVADLDRVTRERLDFAARLEQVSGDLRRERSLAIGRAEALASEHAKALARALAAQAAIRAELIDAEAALAAEKAERSQGGFAARIQSRAARRRRLAKRLLRSGLFDPEFYRQNYASELAVPPGAGAKGNLAAAEHYLQSGFCKGFMPNPKFDTRWYLERYEDVRRSGINPLLHYARHGWREGRDPGPDFQTRFYLDANSDVRAENANPLTHYLKYGRNEGRRALART